MKNQARAKRARSQSKVFRGGGHSEPHPNISGAARNFYWGAKDAGVWGSAPENFSLTTPSALAINVPNAPFIG